MFLCVLQNFFFPLEMVSSIKKVSVRPSIPLLGQWPTWSPCGPRIPASPLLWLVLVGSPSGDMTPVCHSGLSRSGIQNSWTFETQKPDIFVSTLSLSPSWSFDYFWPCPLLVQNYRTFSYFTTPKGKHFIYIKSRAFGKNIGFVRRGVRLLVAPWRASSSQVNTKCSTLNVLGTFLSFVLFLLSLTLVPQMRPVSLPWRMGWSPLPSTSSRRKASLGLGPK